MAKILFIVTGFPSVDHPERCPFNFRAFSALSKCNDVEVLKLSAIYPFRPLTSLHKFNGVTYRTISLPIIKTISKALNEHWLLRKFRRIIILLFVKGEFDIVHAVGGGLAAQIGYEISKSFNTSLIIQYIGSDINFYLKEYGKDKYVSAVINHSKHHVFNSISLMHSFQNIFPDKKNIQVVYRGVNLKQFRFCWHDSEQLNFLFLGGITDGGDAIPKGDLKGGLTLLRSWEQIDSSLTFRTRLFFAGPNSNEERIKTLLPETFDRLKNVRFLGPLNSNEVSKQLQESHVVVIPSYAEGLPNVLLEAMASGNYIISSEVGGIPEVIQNERGGLLFKAGNIEELKQALESVIMNKCELKTCAKYSNDVVQNFSTEQFEEGYNKIYKSVL